MTKRSVDVLMLAGALHPSPLRRQLGMPPLCLPLGDGQTLLTAWLDTLRDGVAGADIQIAVNTKQDAEAIRSLVEIAGIEGAPRVVREPASWRGTGGIIRDLCPDGSGRALLVVEANCLPPASLQSLVGTLDDQTQGVVGTTADDEPTGLYLFEPATLEVIPRIGYFDLKEQLLPALNTSGSRIRAVRVTDRVFRLRDRSSYLQAVRAFAEWRGSTDEFRVSPQATVAASARIFGDSIIEAEVIVEADAVVHDSVLLSGATVERGAVVSRSIVGRGVRIPAAGSILDLVAGESGLESLAGFTGSAVPSTQITEHSRDAIGSMS